VGSEAALVLLPVRGGGRCVLGGHGYGNATK
jgi:hypothetical protein